MTRTPAPGKRGVFGLDSHVRSGVRQVAILGTRGIPAHHGGFETFAEAIALHLQARGWRVTVYCQEQGAGALRFDTWQGINRVLVPVSGEGAFGTVVFDWKSTWHAHKTQRTILTLGYNTAIFCALYRMRGAKNVLNMDGIEWQRGKWGAIARAWLRLNERLGARLGNCLVADHPEIGNHLATLVQSDKICVIPYSSEIIETADEGKLVPFGLEVHSYALVVARAEKENSILEIVKAFSRRTRDFRLIILGDYAPDTNVYQRQVVEHASDEVTFVGAVYDKETVKALRFYARLYIHGHTVGGTNPSLVEALAAGCAVLAHDNRFNRWTAGEGAHYFTSEEDCARELDALLPEDKEILTMQTASRAQMLRHFTAEKVYGAYEELLGQWQ